MKRMIYTALLCCSLFGVSNAQDRSRDTPQDKDTKETSCTTRDSGWSVDVKVAEAHDRQRETTCTERREPAAKEPKSSEPKEPRGPKDKH